MQWKDESRDELPNLSCSISRSAPLRTLPLRLGKQRLKYFLLFVSEFHARLSSLNSLNYCWCFVLIVLAE